MFSIFSHPAVGLQPTTCGRCDAEIATKDEAEVCWYCRGDLCFECWERYGHCGHTEADAQNERIREWHAKREEGRA